MRDRGTGLRWPVGGRSATVAHTRRLAAAAIAGCLGLVAGAITSERALASQADRADAYQLNAAHDGNLATGSLTTPLAQAWSDTLPGASSYPLIVNGTVFVTARGASAYGTTLYALNQATGSTLWSHDLGGTYYWSGLAYDRGQVFTVNYDGVLTAFDPATGSINWSLQLPGQYSFSSPPTAANGIVFVGGAGSGGTLYAVRELDGHLLWTQSVANGDNSSPAVAGSSVYVTYAGQQDYAFDVATGNLLWHYSGPSEGGGGRTPVVASGTVFARDFVSSNLLLSASTGSSLGGFTAGPAPAVANGVAYMLSGSTLKAIANSGQGTTSWSFTGDGSLDTAPLVAGGLVFVGSSTGNLYAVDPSTGTSGWSANVGAGIPGPDEQNVSQPLTGLAVANGTLVVPAGGKLSAYRTAGTIAAVPANQSPPTLDGAPEVGQIVAADVGVWSGLPSSYSYQWQLCDNTGAACADISGATGPSIKPIDTEVGSTLRVKIIASNANGPSSAVTSGASAGVMVGPPTNKTVPMITGTARQGATLSTDPGTWNNSPTGYGYQWRRCSGSVSSCADITGETGSTHVVTAADVGYQLEVKVIASNAAGSSDPAYSALTQQVAPPAPVNQSLPSVSGTPQQGQTLTANPGSWSYYPTSYSYQWFTCDPNGTSCPNINGATNQSYVVQAADVGQYIGVEVVATNSSGASQPADSDAIGPVVPSPPFPTTAPIISGTAQEGGFLTATTGTWANHPTAYGYQWFSCNQALSYCPDIAGANQSTYLVRASDLGRRLGVTVFAANAGGEGNSDSALTAPVSSAPPAPAQPASQPYTQPAPPDNNFLLMTSTVGNGGAISLIESAPDPGTFTAVALTRSGFIASRRATAAVCKATARRRCASLRRTPALYGTASVTATAPGAVRLVIAPNRRSKAALRRGQTLHLTISVTFQSAKGGAPKTTLSSLTVKGKRPMTRKMRRRG